MVSKIISMSFPTTCCLVTRKPSGSSLVCEFVLAYNTNCLAYRVVVVVGSLSFKAAAATYVGSHDGLGPDVYDITAIASAKPPGNFLTCWCCFGRSSFNN